jgi:hypothetical protein
MAVDIAFLDLAAGGLLALAALAALGAGFHRAGWALLALAAPVLTVLVAAVFALRGHVGPASAVIAAGGALGLICAAAAALTRPQSAPANAVGQNLAGMAAGVAIFGALIWAGADPAGLPAPEITLTPEGATLLLGAICAATGLGVWRVLGFGERAARGLPRGAAAPSPAHPRHHAGMRLLLKSMAPIAAGFAVVSTLLAGPGFGLAGGGAAALAVGLFALLFGPAVALRALPPAGLGAAACTGLLTAVAAGAWQTFGDSTGAAVAAHLAGIGLALTMAGAVSLAMLAAMGRVGDLGGPAP